MTEFEKARDEMAENTFESLSKPSQLTFKEIWDLSAHHAHEWCKDRLDRDIQNYQDNYLDMEMKVVQLTQEAEALKQNNSNLLDENLGLSRRADDFEIEAKALADALERSRSALKASIKDMQSEEAYRLEELEASKALTRWQKYKDTLSGLNNQSSEVNIDNKEQK